MTDPELRDAAVAEFIKFAEPKVNSGIEEHNPNGDRGLWRMSPLQLARAVKEESAEMWCYACALEKRLMALQKEFQPETEFQPPSGGAENETET